MTEKPTDKADGTEWRCSKRACRTKKSIRAGSFFAGSHMPLQNQVLFLHLWAQKYPEWLIAKDFNFSLPTIVDWARFCRDFALWYIETQYEIQPIGGVGCTIEIDETLIVKRKYNRGRILSQEWLFGGVERRNDGSCKMFLEFVPNRSAETLIEIIQRRILSGSTIISDGWAAYTTLSLLGYDHKVINHAENFVDLEDAEIHTQRIENFWMHLKRFLRSKGTNRSPHNWEYVCEYMFRKLFPDAFNGLITIMAARYPYI